MKYADFIKGNEGFQYSINIQYDLMNINKIKGYIPTRKSVEILKEYLLNNVVDDRDKATVLIGPYGKGKSHLLLVLLGLMCGDNEIKELGDLVNKIKAIDNTCSELAMNVLNNKKCLATLAETLVASSLYKLKLLRHNFIGLFYDPKKSGVDFLVRNIDKIIPIEVGVGKKTKSQLTKAINNYNSDYGILISNRTFSIKKENNIIYIPLRTFSYI